MKQSILLIEDDPNITDFMEVVLGQERYQLTIASTGMEALTAFQTTSFDLVLLDLGLPDIDGIDLLKILRKRMHLPIIIISARNNEEEKVKALDLGADDYVTKPFGTNELLARIRTALRHQNVQTESLTVVENKDLKIDFEKQLVYKKGTRNPSYKKRISNFSADVSSVGKGSCVSNLDDKSMGPLQQ